MTVQFRESEIWVRGVIVETGGLNAVYLLGCYLLFTQICLHTEVSHVSLEHISFPSEKIFFVQHLS